MRKVLLAASVFLVLVSHGGSVQASTELSYSIQSAASHKRVSAFYDIAAVQPLPEIHWARGLLEPLATFLLAYQGLAAFKPPSLGAGFARGSPINAGLCSTVLNRQSRTGILISQASLRNEVDTKKKNQLSTARIRKRPHGNKRKTPWNSGKSQSSETRNKIRDAMKRRAAEAAEKQKLQRDRLEEEDPEAFAKLLKEEEAQKESQRAKDRERCRLSKKNAKKRKMEETQLERERLKLEAPEEYTKLLLEEQEEAARRSSARRNYTVSAETKAKISASVKKAWKNETYRALQVNKSVSNELRAKLSAISKANWQNASFRERWRQNAAIQRSAECRKKIAAAIRAKWADDKYRNKTVMGMYAAWGRNDTTRREVSLATRKRLSDTFKRKWQMRDFRAERKFRHMRELLKLKRKSRRRNLERRRRALEDPVNSVQFHSGGQIPVSSLPVIPGGVDDPMKLGMVLEHMRASKRRDRFLDNLPPVFPSTNAGVPSNNNEPAGPAKSSRSRKKKKTKSSAGMK